MDQLGIKMPNPSMMVSFMDFRKIPVASLWEETNFGLYGDNLSHGGINMWVNRHAARTTVTVSFPENSDRTGFGSPLHRGVDRGVHRRRARPPRTGSKKLPAMPIQRLSHRSH